MEFTERTIQLAVLRAQKRAYDHALTLTALKASANLLSTDTTTEIITTLAAGVDMAIKDMSAKEE